MEKFDVIIIGGGVVGCMTARFLSRYKLNILLIDKEADVGSSTSAANSAIVHAGYDPLPGTLKAEMNVKGNQMWDVLSGELGFEYDRSGDYVVAVGKEELPILDELLEQNFLCYEGEGPVPSQIHSYLSSNYKELRGLDKEDPALREKAKGRWYVPDPNKQADLERLREKALLREFQAYLKELETGKKQLKQFRTEAIRAGFKKAWRENDYQTIVKVGERLPEKVLQEVDKLLMYYDNALVRLGQ